MTSLVKVLVDIVFSVCFFSSGTSISPRAVQSGRPRYLGVTLEPVVTFVCTIRRHVLDGWDDQGAFNGAVHSTRVVHSCSRPHCSCPATGTDVTHLCRNHAWLPLAPLLLTPANSSLATCCVLSQWCRFMQNIRRYRDTSDRFPHLANAFKYLSL